MDLTFSEDQESVRDLARQIFHRYCSDERLRHLEHERTGFDAELWAELARAHLLGFGVPEEMGGNGGGIIELCLLLEQAGRAAAPVPLWAALVCGVLPVAMFGTEEQKSRLLPEVIEGRAIVTAAFDEPESRDPSAPASVARVEGDEWRIDGTKTEVPAVSLASRVIVPALAADGVGLFLVDPQAPGVTLAMQANTAAEPRAADAAENRIARPDVCKASRLEQAIRQRRAFD